MLNDYFCSVSANIVTNMTSSSVSPLSYLSVPTKSSFSFQPVAATDILRLISQLSVRKSSGFDGLSARVIKCFSVYLASPLSIIINKSLSDSIVPVLWKSAIITPVVKKKGDFSMNNFRPVSVLPVLSKQVVYYQLYNYFISNDLLSSCQSGFRPGYSTQDVLLHVTDTWRKAIDNREYVGAVFLDISKAFDCVNHSVLLDKLRKYFLDNAAIGWFESYFSSRRQQVKLNDEMSDWRHIDNGVPQGSVLGPLLFAIYINDLPDVILSSYIDIYADDVVVYRSSQSITDLSYHLQNDLDRIHIWLSANQLSLNFLKSVCMLIGSPQKVRGIDWNVIIDQRKLSRVSSVKYLGMHINESLNWTEHFNNILRKSQSKFFAIRRLQPIPHHVTYLLYRAFILPILDYCDVVYGPVLVKLLIIFITR